MMRLPRLETWLALCAIFAAGLAQAGEIVILPSPGNQATSSEREASRLREAARAERKGQIPAETAPVLIIPEEEAGVLSPRQTPSAAENIDRARARRKESNGSGTAIVVPLVEVPVAPPSSPAESAQQHARRNRERAIEYRNGERPSGLATNPGRASSSENLPLIDCQAVDNVSGRIGDDTSSGNIIILVRDRQQIRVRCR